MDTKKRTIDMRTYLRVGDGRRMKVEKLPIGYYGYYPGDQISCTPKPYNLQFTYITNPEPKITVKNKYMNK